MLILKNLKKIIPIKWKFKDDLEYYEIPKMLIRIKNIWNLSS